MNIFVTGASGFVGGAIVSALRKSHKIVAMSRSEKSDAAIKKLGAKPVRSELGNVDSSLLKKMDVVIHAAAFVEQWGTREQFWETNVTATQQLLAAAREAGVKRFIFISTEASLFYGQDMIDIDENYPYPERTPFLYSETKGAAERLVLAASARNFVTLSIRPRLVWGPGDKTILPVLADMVNTGRFMWIEKGSAATDTTHIANLVEAVRLALKKGKSGNAYFVTDGEATHFRPFLTAYLATQGINPPAKSVPGWLARFLGLLLETIWKLFRSRNEPPLTRFAAAIMSRSCTIRIDKARSDLGYKPVISVQKGLQQMPRL